MSAATSIDQGSARRKRRLTVEVKDALRDLSIQLSLLNRQAGFNVDLKDADWDCLEILNRRGPMGPSALARRAGLHPATMTGVLDRLERAGWIARDRDPADRRAVTIRALGDRNAEVYALFSGMNASMDEICAGYTEDQLKLFAEFMHRTTAAGLHATSDLAQRTST